LNTIYIPEFTKFYNIAIGNVAGICVETAERIKTSYQHRPDNAITLLDKVCAATILRHNYKIETETDPAIKQILEQTPITITERNVEQYTAKENFTMPDQTTIDNVKFDIQFNDDFIDNIFNKIQKFIKRNELF
jgi:hypothetical protein